MATLTINYETPKFLQSVLGNDLTQLKSIQDTFQVKAITRDGWIRLDGEKDQVEAAAVALGELEKVIRQGGSVSPSMIRMILDNVKKPWMDEPAEKVLKLRLLGSSRRPPVMAKTRGQVEYIRAMQENEVVFGVGSAGSGKTYLAMAQALQCLRDKTVTRLILTRPAVEAGEALGFLPGDLKEKVFPYLRPLYDALYEMVDVEEADRMIEKGIIEIAPLAYMRGRTLKNAFVILDEAQNTTEEQMFMFLTRLGEGSRCAVTGDPSQIDLRRGVRSGLVEALQILHTVDSIKIIKFKTSDVVRLAVVQRIIDAYKEHRSIAD